MLSTTGLPQGAVPKLERPGPLRDRVYEALLELITTRALQPGQHLVESELAGHLGVSRQPVREALQRLNTEGWVDPRPAEGAFVHEPTEAEADQLDRCPAHSWRPRPRPSLPERRAASAIAVLEELCAEGERAVAADDVDAVVAMNAWSTRRSWSWPATRSSPSWRWRFIGRVRWYYMSLPGSAESSPGIEHRELIAAVADSATSSARDGDHAGLTWNTRGRCTTSGRSSRDAVARSCPGPARGA